MQQLKGASVQPSSTAAMLPVFCFNCKLLQRFMLARFGLQRSAVGVPGNASTLRTDAGHRVNITATRQRLVQPPQDVHLARVREAEPDHPTLYKRQAKDV